MKIILNLSLDDNRGKSRGIQLFKSLQCLVVSLTNICKIIEINGKKCIDLLSYCQS